MVNRNRQNIKNNGRDCFCETPLKTDKINLQPLSVAIQLEVLNFSFFANTVMFPAQVALPINLRIIRIYVCIKALRGGKIVDKFTAHAGIRIWQKCSVTNNTRIHGGDNFLDSTRLRPESVANSRASKSFPSSVHFTLVVDDAVLPCHGGSNSGHTLAFYKLGLRDRQNLNTPIKEKHNVVHFRLLEWVSQLHMAPNW